jgi:hypothetical protein
MRFTRIVTALLGAGLLSLPVLAMVASPANAAAPASTTLVNTQICSVVANGGCIANSARTQAAQFFGKTLRVTGKLQSGSVGASAQTVALQRRAAGSTVWASAGSATTGADGAFTVNVAASTNAAYRVIFPGTTTYAGSTSAAVSAKVLRNLGARQHKISGPKFRFYGKVTPKYAKKKVVLQRKIGASGHWKTIGSQKTTALSKWSFTVLAKRTRGSVFYRAFTPASVSYVKSYTPDFKITTR